MSSCSSSRQDAAVHHQRHPRFSKLEVGKLDIAATPVDLKVLIESCVGWFEAAAREKGLALDCAIARICRASWSSMARGCSRSWPTSSAMPSNSRARASSASARAAATMRAAPACRSPSAIPASAFRRKSSGCCSSASARFDGSISPRVRRHRPRLAIRPSGWSAADGPAASRSPAAPTVSAAIVTVELPLDPRCRMPDRGHAGAGCRDSEGPLARTIAPTRSSSRLIDPSTWLKRWNSTPELSCGMPMPYR